MSDFEKYFDAYSLNARVKPALFLVFPVVLSIFVLAEPSRTWGGATITFVLTFGIINFVTNQASTQGNILQERLFHKWGGAPTTIILRHADYRLDRHTKARYMENLSRTLGSFEPVTEHFETENPQEADEIYRTAANYLIERTRDKNIYPLIFNENVAYGFSRNLRAFKFQGISICTVSLIVNLVVLYLDLHLTGRPPVAQYLHSIPIEYYGLIVIHLVTLGLWIFLVTEQWVQIRGFLYAKRLYAACESLDG